MKRFTLFAVFGLMLLCACAPGSRPAAPDLKQQVMETERAFAKSMADRDHAAFSGFLSGEAIFFGGPTPLRGKQQVAEGWKRYFETPDAPFSWEPEEVEDYLQNVPDYSLEEEYV